MRKGMVFAFSSVMLWIPAIAGNTANNSAPALGDWSRERTVCRPVPLCDVEVRGFLGSHIDANNARSLLAGLESPIPKAIEAVTRGEQPSTACKRLATDSDFHKWLEGACYALAYDPKQKAVADAVARYVPMLLELQDKDGFIGTRLSPAKPFDEDVSHDLYVCGHFIEAAVAHCKATGDRRLLDAAARYADFYIEAWRKDHPYFKIVGGGEHPEIEAALVRLYRATGEKRFLDFAAAIARMATVTPNLAEVRAGGGRTHAVRLCYLLSGYAELYIETGDGRFLDPLRPLWDEIATRRMYITGGIGYNEHVPVQPYDLPQYLENNRNRDIAETCASVAMMMFSWRMHAISGESRYFDTIETILYNHYLGAISLDHLGNFYYNPLRRTGDLTGKTDHGGPATHRTRLPAIHSTACCLPNAWRFFGQLPEYIFSLDAKGVRVNLYSDAKARFMAPYGTPVRLDMRTWYPHEGTVRIRIELEKPAAFRLGLRIPSWCEGARVSVAGGALQFVANGEYCNLEREWRNGEEVRLELPMKPVAVLSRPEVTANRGQVAFQRGPLVYCLEKCDAAGLDLERTAVVLNESEPSRSVEEVFDADLGLWVLKASAGLVGEAPADDRLYFPAGNLALNDTREVRLIPFFYRANREQDTRWITWIPYR